MNSKARAAIAEAKANLARMEQDETDEVNENCDGSLFEDPVAKWRREGLEREERKRNARGERKLSEEVSKLRQQLDDVTGRVTGLTSQLLAARQEVADTRELILEAVGGALKELSEQLLGEMQAIAEAEVAKPKVQDLPNPIGEGRVIELPGLPMRRNA